VAAAGPRAAAALEIASVLGLELSTGEEDVPEEVRAWVRERDEARAARDWARADALRDRITAAGYVGRDRPSGAVLGRAGVTARAPGRRPCRRSPARATPRRRSGPARVRPPARAPPPAGWRRSNRPG